MKHFTVLLLLLLSAYSANAQFGENHAIYASSGLHAGNYFGLNSNIDYVYKEKYSFRIGYSIYIREPDSKPDDFSLGLFDALSLFNHFDQLETYQIMVGRVYKFNKRGTIRLNLSIGLGLTNSREPENWQRTNSFLFSRNYNWDYNEFQNISFIINPKIEFPLTRYAGLAISPIFQINKDRTYFGIGLESMLGLLRKRNKL
ncbi:hypothetical protein [Kordia jejudonensis]|uniref:hypothetical protein n=1 Tax=Kordia jejudonensis TaxID=1348245 RepID=UPI0006295191|nr:hypothetical protein [Kordia jejudonensis]